MTCGFTLLDRSSFPSFQFNAADPLRLIYGYIINVAESIEG